MIKVLLITLFFSLELFAAEVKLNAKVDRAIVTTGDMVMFTISLDTPKALSLQIPNMGDKIQGLRVVDFGANPEKVVDGRNISSLWYKLQADLVGSYILPAVELKYKNAQGIEEMIKSSEIFVEVESVLSKDKNEKKDIRDIKPIILSAPIWPYYLFGLLVAMGLIGAAVYYLKRIRKKSSSFTSIVPPHLVALDALLHLPMQPIKLYAFTLSEIIRIYFEKTFVLPVTDRTIEEIKREIASVTLLSEALKTKFMKILEMTDLIKFTDATLVDEDCESLTQMARQFIQETMPAPLKQENEEDSVV